ncbi:MAG: hypothetical protein MI976_23215 [Pseudomonadales bacterium]|nr:hypothetical protein [Pseudomonadales bacterium]
MFRKSLLGTIVLISIFSGRVSADDLEIYEGATATVTAPVELVFAIDTSTSMACSLDQTFGVLADQKRCFVNVHPEFLDDAEFLLDLDLTGYSIPDDVKMSTVKEVLDSILAPEADVLTDDVRVGLAFYKPPGGSIVQPLRELGYDTNDTSYSTHRAIIRGEIQNIMPQGSTPILGTLLEVGQYLTGGHVIAGKSRAPEPLLASDNGYSRFASRVRSSAESYGETNRISHPDTTIENTRSYSADAACLAEIASDVVTGKAHVSCSSEALLDADADNDVLATYNEDINMAQACVGNPDLEDSVVTTQVVLITDGLSTSEGMEVEVSNQRMGTWVKRFVTGDANATGFLASNEAFDQSAEGFPEAAQFTDLGCQITATSSTKTTGSLVDLDADDDGTNDLEADADLTATELTYPSREVQGARYNSCVYNVANRFRELGVRVHVIGFALGASVENEKLYKIAEITGGRWIDTSDADQVREFLRSIADTGTMSSTVSVPLSPSVSVNPGSILANSEDVYMPMFQASANSFRYGNLRKYRLETTTETIVETDDEGNEVENIVEETVLVGANGEATEECQITDTDDNIVETYVCFRDTSRDLWSDENNGNTVTLGAAASQQGEFGPTGRNVFIQHDGSLESLALLDLSSEETDDKVESTNNATRSYYAQLTPDPDNEGSTFADYSTLAGHEDADILRRLERPYDLLRWLAGFDKPRFGDDGVFNGAGPYNERSLLGASAPVADDANLSASRLYHGAYVHSTPIVVNYGFSVSGDNTYEYDNVVFISGNDGFLRALDADDGTEEFSFFPSSLIPNIATMYENNPGGLAYGLDSTWTPWRQDVPNGEGVFDGQITEVGGNDFIRLYGGMRRGGHSYYILDVTDRDDPDLLMEINRNTDTHFASLGQTWSEPVLAKIKKPGATTPTVVTIFGGGFDPAYDEDDLATASSECTSDTDDSYCGSQIYILDAGGYTAKSDTATLGDLIWWASDDGVASSDHAVVSNMNHSIPSKVKTLDIDGDGLTDRVYVGDLGGQVFRITIDNNAAAGDNDYISIATLAQVGFEREGTNATDAADNRVFFDSPSVAVMRNGSGTRYVGVAIASGWREKPKDQDVDEEFYFFRDTLEEAALSIMTRPGGNYGNEDFITHIESIAEAPESIRYAFDSADAFALSLNADAEYPGEKAFGSPIILMGNAFFPSYLPPTEAETSQSLTACEPPPQRSRLTAFRVQSGSPQITINEDGSVTVSPATDAELPVVSYTQPERSVPLSGIGVHVGNDSVSILSGTKALNIAIDDDVIRKTLWENLARGSEAIPDNAVSTETESE